MLHLFTLYSALFLFPHVWYKKIMPLPQFQKKTINPDHGLGSRLKAVREQKNISLTQAEHETKIRAKYLEAIENNHYSLISASHVKGFIRRYAEFLELPPESVKQELGSLSLAHTKDLPFSPRPLAKDTQWIVTPKIIAIVLSILVFIAFIGYITYQVKQFAAPPKLEITQPANESVVASDTFDIKGKTEPGATVYIDTMATSADSDGLFSYPVTLRPGLNQITVRAENRIKKQSTKIVSILYQAPATPASPAPEVSPSPSPTNSAKPTASP